MPNQESPLPRRLKAARLAAGLSQKSLGIAADLDEFVASTRINQYERGVHAPNYMTVQRLAHVLKVPTAYFYADDDQHAQLLLQFNALSKPAQRALLQSLKQ